MNWFICVVPNNQCWSGWYNNFGNVVTRCCRFPYLSCISNFICMLNRCGVLSIWLCVWPSSLGQLLGYPKHLVKGTYGSLLSSCSANIWWRGKFVVINFWGLMLGTSIGWIPSAWRLGCSCGGITSWTCCCGVPNYSCFLRPLVTTFDISHWF